MKMRGITENLLLLALFAVYTTGYSQITFEPVLPLPPSPQLPQPSFIGLNDGSIAIADIDGDNDQDVLITGRIQNFSNLTYLTVLYANDGHGNYTEVPNTPFIPVAHSSVAFADVDGDNDQDVLITGQLRDLSYNATLYLNDGHGNYTEVPSTPFAPVAYSSIAFADVDGDNDQDVLITGRTRTNDYIAKLYSNDGQGGYSELSNTPFIGVTYSSVAFADIDGDHDQDVLISGKNKDYTSNPILYTNDGQGNYTQILNAPFSSLRSSSIAFADIDSDDDQDVLIGGYNEDDEPTTTLYTNNGLGNYIEVADPPFDGLFDPTFTFVDFDSDNDQDLIFIGQDNNRMATNALYINNGEGNYTKVTDTPFVGVKGHAIAITDADGDGDPDVLIAGESLRNYTLTNLYTNNGAGAFVEVTGTPFPKVTDSSIAVADIDNDGDQDALVTGLTRSHTRITTLHVNDGQGNYTEVSSHPFAGVSNSEVAFFDADNDGDQDVILTGMNSDREVATALYFNNGLGMFTEVTDAPFTGVSEWPTVGILFTPSFAIADVDGDNDQDLLISAWEGEYSSIFPIYLYVNNGQGEFEKVDDTTFKTVSTSSFEFADIDRDGDQDLIITGQLRGGELVASIYTNDGKGNFSEEIDKSIDGLTDSSIAFGDADGDNDLDMLIAGGDSNRSPITNFYVNDGQGIYTKVEDSPFARKSNSSFAFGDVDGDNDLDILIAEQNMREPKATLLYVNDGRGNFTPVSNTPFSKVGSSFVTLANIDSDSDLDILITGGGFNGPLSEVYRNTGTCNTALVADAMSLPTLSGQCYVEAPLAPTASSECEGTITGSTTTVFPITDINIEEITWIYTDSQGSTITQTQAVELELAGEAPVAGVPTLPKLVGTCFITTPPSPTAMDECDGEIIGTTNTDFPIVDASIREIVWTYTNSKGMRVIQIQEVALDNTESPIVNLETLPTLTGQCSIENPSPPTATDACNGDITGTPNIQFPITDPSVNEIIWTYTDSQGNRVTQTQAVTLADTQGPIANTETLPILTGTCSITAPTAPTAIDECGGQVMGTTNTEFPIADTSIEHVVWTYTDRNGNITTQTQAVVFLRLEVAITNVGDTLQASIGDATYQWLNCSDNFAVITGETSQTFPLSQSGSYAVEVTRDECTERSACIDMNVLGVVENTFTGEVKLYPNPTHGAVAVVLDQPYLNTHVTVQSVTGQVVQQQHVGYGKVLTLSINQPRGIYVVTVTSGAHQAVIRVIKN